MNRSPHAAFLAALTRGDVQGIRRFFGVPSARAEALALDARIAAEGLVDNGDVPLMSVFVAGDDAPPRPWFIASTDGWESVFEGLVTAGHIRALDWFFDADESACVRSTCGFLLPRALASAAHAGDAAIVDRLLASATFRQQLTDPERERTLGRLLALVTAWGFDPVLAHVLVAHGAEASTAGCLEGAAAFDRDGAIVEFLVEHGTMVIGNAASLAVAVAQNQLAAVRVLLRHGADPRSPCDFDVITGDEDDDAYDIDGNDEAHDRARHRHTPLHEAARRGLGDMAAQLMDDGVVDVDARDPEGKTPVMRATDETQFLAQGMWAAGASEVAVVEAFLARGASVDVHDHSGDSVLMGPCRNVSVRVLNALLQAGANPNAPGAGGRTPVHAVASRAAWPAASEALRLLLRYGGDLERPRDDGVTSLRLLNEYNEGRVLLRQLQGHGGLKAMCESKI